MNARLSVLVAIAVPVLISGVSAGEKENKLVDAARQGDLPAVKQLIAGGDDVNATSEFSITPLWQASWKGHRDVVRFLLEAGANPNARDEVWKVTPLILADDAEVVALLVKHGAEDVAAKLRMAAHHGDEELLSSIVNAKTIDYKLLASAKAQAELGSHANLVKLLEEVAGKTLPSPPEVSEKQLKTYVGKYVSDDLEEVEVGFANGQLTLNRSGAAAMRPIARDENRFDFGARTYTFETNGGKVTALTESTSWQQSIYTRVEVAEDSVPRYIADAGDWTWDDGIAAKKVWPSFRGRAARGIAVGQNLPADWSVETGAGVRWKTPIPGLGNSCPVVWRDRVFVTTAISSAGNADLKIGLYGAGDSASDQSEHSWRLYCLDKTTGRIIWHRVADERVPPVERHTKSSQANSTPATDGKHVVALFNSGALLCYDLEGTLLWKRDVGVLDSGAFNDPDLQWGFGSSPIIHESTVILQCDRQKDSFLAAYEIASGREVWRVPRDESPSWGTPTIHETSRGPLLIANATNHVRGYDARTGRSLWQLTRNAAITVPTPIVGHNLIFITSGYRPIYPIYAVRLNAVGDISLADGEEANEGIAWSKSRGGPYLPTPILYGNYFYTCGNNGVLTCYEAKTGKRLYRRRCGSGSATSFTASPVACDGKIYLTAEAGVVYAVKAGPKFEILREHPVGEYCLATPAIAGGVFLLRTKHQVIAIGAEDKDDG